MLHSVSVGVMAEIDRQFHSCYSEEISKIHRNSFKHENLTALTTYAKVHTIYAVKKVCVLEQVVRYSEKAL